MYFLIEDFRPTNLLLYPQIHTLRNILFAEDNYQKNGNVSEEESIQGFKTIKNTSLVLVLMMVLLIFFLFVFFR